MEAKLIRLLHLMNDLLSVEVALDDLMLEAGDMLGDEWLDGVDEFKRLNSELKQATGYVEGALYDTTF